MTSLSLSERADRYRAAFPRQPASWPWLTTEQGRPVLYAVWVIGARYGNASRLYGAYPRTYLERVWALYPDVDPARALHAFSGSVSAGPWTRLDANPEREPDVVGSVLDAPSVLAPRIAVIGGRFQLALADPPYSAEDAKRYGTPMVNRRLAVRALAKVVEPGRHLVWLDTCWPIHSKREWVTVGRVLVQRSTMHRARVMTLFERTGEERRLWEA